MVSGFRHRDLVLPMDLAVIHYTTLFTEVRWIVFPKMATGVDGCIQLLLLVDLKIVIFVWIQSFIRLTFMVNRDLDWFILIES